jgi:uncharacterized protein YkwD
MSFTQFRQPLSVAAIVLVVSTFSGIIGGVSSQENITANTTIDKVTNQTVPSTTTTSPPPSSLAPTTTTTSPTVDYTIDFIDTSNLEEVRFAWNSLRRRPTNKLQWSGSVAKCVPGTTSDAFKDDVLHRTQWFRAMAGVNPQIFLDSALSSFAQAAALVMHANNDLSHYPTSAWECFSEDAYEGASNSNLYLGRNGEKSIIGYIEDSGSDNLPVGHRRWILSPFLQRIGTGDTPNTNALFVADDVDSASTPRVREPDGFVMWPPRGYVPRQMIFTRWSVSHPTANFDDAIVRIQHSGKTRYFTKPYVGDEPYGRLNSLTFEWKRPDSKSPVDIEVSNISIDGVFTVLKYTVLPFD